MQSILHSPAILVFLKHLVHEATLRPHTFVRHSRPFTVESHSHLSYSLVHSSPIRILCCGHTTHLTVPTLHICGAVCFFLAYFPPPILVPKDSVPRQFFLPSTISSVSLLFSFFLNSYNFIIGSSFFPNTDELPHHMVAIMFYVFKAYVTS